MSQTNPLHVFMVIDGNRRWARRRGLHPWEGHRAGYERFKEVLEYVWGYGVTHLTVLVFSRANREKRNPEQTQKLMELLDEGMAELLESSKLHEKRVRLVAVGDWPRNLSQATRKQIEELEKQTAIYRERTLTILIDYDGKWEITETFNRLCGSFKKRGFDEIKAFAPTSHLPKVDLYIRTEEEEHLSGAALPFQMINPELIFPKCMWPDFIENEFQAAIKQFHSRRRRNGA